jgi:ribosomal protein S18 acetylase RimI-like enzyme
VSRRVADITIRNYQPSDEAAVQEITFRTGFKGSDLTGRNYFDDKRLFFVIFIYYYTRYEPEHFFVAVDTKDDTVLGFIGGTTDTAAQERGFQKKMPWRIASRALLITSWRYPRTFKTVMSMMRMMGDIQENEDKRSILRAEYPAHLHINLLPDYQSMGLGTRMMERFEEHLIGQGVKGVHLQTTSHNRKAIPFYKKMGFTIFSQVEATSHPGFDDLKLLTFVKKLAPAQGAVGE